MNKRLFKFSGTASIIQAVLYVVTVVTVGFLPGEQIFGNLAQFTSSYSSRPLPLVILSLCFVLLGLLGFVFVAPATIELFPKANRWLLAGKYIAKACLITTAGYFIWFLFILPHIPAFALHTPLNWIAWFTFGGMGLFVIIIGASVWLTRVLPSLFVLVCAIKALGFWAILFGIIFNDLTVVKIGTIFGGLIGGPTYHIWLGLALRKKSLTINK